MYVLQRGQSVFRFGLTVQGRFAAVTDKGGGIVIDAERFGVCQRVVHAQRVGLHFFCEELSGNIGETFLVTLVGEEEKRHACEDQQKDSAEYQLSGGKPGLLFQNVTLG